MYSISGAFPLLPIETKYVFYFSYIVDTNFFYSIMLRCFLNLPYVNASIYIENKGNVNPTHLCQTLQQSKREICITLSFNNISTTSCVSAPQVTQKLHCIWKKIQPCIRLWLGNSAIRGGGSYKRW